MDRESTTSITSTTTMSNETTVPNAPHPILRNLAERLGARRTSTRRSTFACAIANADKALQREYIRYGHPCAPDPRLDAYHNVQQVLALVLHPERGPNYVEPQVADVAYATENERLAEVVERVWVERCSIPGR